MNSPDPLLFGLLGEQHPPKQPEHLAADPPDDTDSLVETAEKLLNAAKDSAAPDHEPNESPISSFGGMPPPDAAAWNGDIPAGTIGAASGQPFTDWDSADYKAKAMMGQTGDSFFVRALAADRFVVAPDGGAPLASDTPAQHIERDESSDDRAYLEIPINQLTLKDFPADHPVHRCGLSRYKRYMKKNFKFKPAYRSMWSILFLVPFGVLTYFYPVATLSLLPADVINDIVSSVPPEKLAQGVSAFGGLLAVFASGRVLWQRHLRRYMLNPGFAKYEEGILRRESTKIAYLNIVNYDVKQSILGRLLNYGTIELSSAGSDGSEIEMHNVLAPRLIEVVLEGKMAEAKRAR